MMIFNIDKSADFFLLIDCLICKKKKKKVVRNAITVTHHSM